MIVLKVNSQIKGGLSTEAFQSYAPLVFKEAQQFFEHELDFASTPQTLEVFRVMAELIILTACRTLQGKEIRAALDSGVAKYFEDLDGGLTALNFIFPNLPLPNNWRRDKAQKKITIFYTEIMRKRQEGVIEAGSEVSHIRICWVCLKGA